MMKPNPSLDPDWDEINVAHIAKHGLRPDQIEEMYYGEGPYPTFALRNENKKRGTSEYRYRLWGTDASGTFIEAIIAPYPKYGLWRCVTAYPMSPAAKHAYLRRIKK